MTKALIFLLGAAAGTAAAYLYLTPVTGSAGDLDDLASKAGRWGSKQRITGAGHEALGKLKQGVGETTGNSQLTNEGMFQQAKGAVKDAAGKAAHAAVDAIQDASQ